MWPQHRWPQGAVGAHWTATAWGAAQPVGAGHAGPLGPGWTATAWVAAEPVGTVYAGAVVSGRSWACCGASTAMGLGDGAGAGTDASVPTALFEANVTTTWLVVVCGVVAGTEAGRAGCGATGG